MKSEVGSPTWDCVDPWWDTFVTTQSAIGVEETTKRLDNRWQAELWEQMDPWWKALSEVRQSDVAELRGALDDSNQAWKQSESRFDKDPLATDWTPDQNTRGPLRPNQEENWSQWLAHLCRSSSGAFLSELFGDQFSESPETVECEAHLPDQRGTDRYADILAQFQDRGLSVEVKKNDANYAKTTHTAGLIEQQYPGDWLHTLLLPQYKQSALRNALGEDVISDETDSISLHSEQSSPITVVYWREVSQAIRNVLQNGSERDPHFEASAYSFCTLVEQKLLQFTPYPAIERIATTDDVIHASRSLSVATGGMEEQIIYLRECENEHDE